MKKCPFCNTEIEENARFCLYCMKTLNEKEVITPHQKKRPRWVLIPIGVALLFLVAILLLPPKDTATPSGPAPLGSQPPTLGPEAPSDNPAPEDPSAEDPVPEDSADPPPSEDNTEPTGGQQEPAGPPVDETPGPSDPTTDPTLPTDPTPEQTEPEEPEPEQTEPDQPSPSAVYSYRTAQAGDDFNANYTNSGNDIVITGISQQSADGVYDMPAYIDGQKVIAIVANAFSGTNAKTVYLPTTVKSVWNHAFAGCSLTDIYFRGNAIYVESNAFSAPLTIHCSANCTDRNYRYYKNNAQVYGATWVEWND